MKSQHHHRTITINDAYQEGRKLMTRATKKPGTTFKGGTEDRRFRSCFGVGAHVAVQAWNMMVEKDLLPEIGNFCHYMWALMFMKLYGENETEMCMLLGGTDPKTMRKYVWPYIFSIFELHYDVVSSTICLFVQQLTLVYANIASRYCLKTERWGIPVMIACSRLMGLIYASLRSTPRIFGRINLRSVA